ncbi:MAG: GDSL-type esterase/lipase family protein [Porphyromonadaceae bacterium]|nr:GDSL-type esterase/lipase family protein [Porphyromonadaceae bacterium]
MKRLFFLWMGLCAIWALSAQNLHVVYIGNSITQGVILKNPQVAAPPVQSTQFLQEALQGTVDFRNCGISGHTTLNFLPVTGTDFPNVVAAAEALSAQNGTLLFSIMLGTNDSAERGPMGAPVHPVSYYTNLQAIINGLLERFPQAIFVIHHPIWYSPNTYNSSTYLANGLKRLQSYWPMIDKLVESYAENYPGQVFLGDTLAFDYFKENHDELLFHESGQAGTFFLHPNPEGAKVLGRFWSDAILNCLPATFKRKR